MTDFHSHILPEIDDGSRSVEESLLMINELSRQGIDRIIATPHFYADDESVNGFLERRQTAYNKLMDNCFPGMPSIIQGAEVRYYDGISRLPNLNSLCIQGTKLLLLEMPFIRWTEYTLRELVDISSNGKITLVLAHIDRYLKFQRPDVWYWLADNGILMQLNANCVNNFFTRHKAINLFRKGIAHFLGSDCHNMKERAPDIGQAINIMEKKLGINFKSDFDDYVNEFFEIKNLKI